MYGIRYERGRRCFAALRWRGMCGRLADISPAGLAARGEGGGGGLLRRETKLGTCVGEGELPLGGRPPRAPMAAPPQKPRKWGGGGGFAVRPPPPPASFSCFFSSRFLAMLANSRRTRRTSPLADMWLPGCLPRTCNHTYVRTVQGGKRRTSQHELRYLHTRNVPARRAGVGGWAGIKRSLVGAAFVLEWRGWRGDGQSSRTRGGRVREHLT